MVKKLVAAVALVAVAALMVAALAAGGRSKEIMVGAKLNAKQEVPAQAVKAAKAKGVFTATLVGRKLKWKLTFSHLSGPAAAAHIHMGAMGVAGNVLVPLCGPCKNGAHGTTTVSTAVKSALAKHLAYVNVHTAKNPNGEIRGQISEH